MAEVVWTDAALHELTQIRAYIAVFDPAAADRMTTRLMTVGESLANFPGRGRPVSDGVREMTTVPPYVLRYEVAGDRVVILRIRHGARRPD